MYTKRIQLINYGPVEKLDIEFPFESATPKPVVLVGANGSGKSILLSHIVNGLVNAKDIVYPASPEVEPGRVYKFKTNFYIKSGSQFSFGRVDFEEGFFVSELTTMLPKREYSEHPPGILGTAAEPMWRGTEPVSNDHSESNFNIDYDTFNKLKEVFASNCILYFPSNRFEEPAWLNKQNLTAQAEYVDRRRVVAHTNRQVIALSPLLENQNWLFDVIYDRRVPETRAVRVPIPLPGGEKPWYLEAERAEIRDHDEGVLKAALQVVRQVLRDNSNAGFRIGRRGNRFVGLHGDDGTIVPNIFQLSSGETSLLNLFLSILRDFELSGSQFSNAANIRGIVVVDEIDLHLHTTHQYEVLPKLIQMFPRVQFVLTTHSPLLVLGLQNVFTDSGFGLYRLPHGRQISPEEFSEFGHAFRVFKKTDVYLSEMEAAIRSTEKPLIFVDGTTDIRYLERAMALLGWGATLVDVEIRDGGGEGNLKKAWRTLTTMTVVRQTVVLFHDCESTVSLSDCGNVFRRRVPSVEDNPIRRGIENLFDKKTLARAMEHKSAFIDVTAEHEVTERGQTKVVPEQWKVNQDEKSNLCDWLCKNGTSEDFRCFSVILDELCEIPDMLRPIVGDD